MKYPRIWIASRRGPWLAARDPDAPPEVLALLARSRECMVRAKVAVHPNTPVDVLRKLANDRTVQVLEELAKNPALPLDVIEKLATQEPFWEAREFIAKNPATPVSVNWRPTMLWTHVVRCLGGSRVL